MSKNMTTLIKGNPGKPKQSSSNYEIANEVPDITDNKEKVEVPTSDGPIETVPREVYNTLKTQYYAALKDAENYKRQLDEAYTVPERIPLWQCIKTKLFGSSVNSLMYRGIFGYFSVWDINKHRDSYPWNDRPEMKIRYLINYITPSFLDKHLESIGFYNIYNTSEDGEKYTALVFSGTENLYWIYFRKKKTTWGPGDWHWCLKFSKETNDHVGCG